MTHPYSNYIPQDHEGSQSKLFARLIQVTRSKCDLSCRRLNKRCRQRDPPHLHRQRSRKRGNGIMMTWKQCGIGLALLAGLAPAVGAQGIPVAPVPAPGAATAVATATAAPAP